MFYVRRSNSTPSYQQTMATPPPSTPPLTILHNHQTNWLPSTSESLVFQNTPAITTSDLALVAKSDIIFNPQFALGGASAAQTTISQRRTDRPTEQRLENCWIRNHLWRIQVYLWGTSSRWYWSNWSGGKCCCELRSNVQVLLWLCSMIWTSIALHRRIMRRATALKIEGRSKITMQITVNHQFKSNFLVKSVS
jgi:hypothetical protein